MADATSCLFHLDISRFDVINISHRELFVKRDPEDFALDSRGKIY